MANEAVQREFLANPEGKRNRKQETITRQRNLGRKKPIKPESDEMKANKKRWATIKASMIQAQVQLNGYTQCVLCGTIDPKPLDLDHIIPTGDDGGWWPSNAMLVGRNCCHSEKHGKPRWTRDEQAFADKFKDGAPFSDESPSR